MSVSLLFRLIRVHNIVHVLDLVGPLGLPEYDVPGFEKYLSSKMEKKWSKLMAVRVAVRVAVGQTPKMLKEWDQARVERSQTFCSDFSSLYKSSSGPELISEELFIDGVWYSS